MASKLKDISNYFEHLSTQHKLVLHQATPGYKAYEVRTIEAALGDIRTGGAEKGYLVRFILPTVELQGWQQDARKKYQVGLLVARYVSRRNGEPGAEITAMAEAEAVADSFLAHIVRDSRNGHPLFGYNADDVDNLKATGDFLPYEEDGSYVAFMYLFDLSMFQCLDISCEADVWLDNGLTPL